MESIEHILTDDVIVSLKWFIGDNMIDPSTFYIHDLIRSGFVRHEHFSNFYLTLKGFWAVYMMKSVLKVECVEYNLHNPRYVVLCG